MPESMQLAKAPPASGETPRQILILFAAIAATLGIGMVGYYASGLRGEWPFPRDQAGYTLGRDFLNTWFFGKAAFLSDSGRFYDREIYGHWINDVVPHDIVTHLWSYPPSFLFVAAPFGLLPYPLAFATWSAAGMLALYAVLRSRALQTTAILFSPAALFCLIGGQVSLFIAAVTLAALRLLDRRPWIAGLLIALCTIKPQIGLLFPILLIASRRWRALLAATLGTTVLILASACIWGFDIWRDYISIGVPTQIADTKETYGVLAPWSPTITTAIILAGVGQYAAQVVQIAFACLAAALVIIGCGNGPMNERRIALFLVCTVFAAPYLLAHDLVAATAAVVMLAAAAPLDRTGGLLVKAMFLLPMLQFATAILHLPGMAFLPVAFALWAVAQKDEATAARGRHSERDGTSLTPSTQYEG